MLLSRWLLIAYDYLPCLYSTTRVAWQDIFKSFKYSQQRLQNTTHHSKSNQLNQVTTLTHH